MNIVEILKDCPKGTKLYSPLYGDVRYEYIDDTNTDYPIYCRRYNDNVPISFTKEGFYFSKYKDAECLLFPSKDNRDWSTFKALKIEFKKGDFVYIEDKNDVANISIYKETKEGNVYDFADLFLDTYNVYFDLDTDMWGNIKSIKHIRLATEEEKQKLLKALDEKDYVWDVEKLELRKKEYKFKPFDKVEPKFKVGDYVINEHGFVMQIADVKDSHYVYMYEGKELSATIEQMENSCHLWTIQDAKDGDVLASKNGCPFIYKKSDDIKARIYCCVSINNKFCIDDGINYCGYKELTKPATSEQRNLLFSKMNEAGYEWDAEKKELKKITKKSTWSEEDDKMLTYTIDTVELHLNHIGSDC